VRPVDPIVRACELQALSAATGTGETVSGTLMERSGTTAIHRVGQTNQITSTTYMALRPLRAIHVQRDLTKVIRSN
jgi:hypothetical protein